MPLDTRTLRGVSLLIGGMYALDVFSSFMSSPWSTRTFAGADPVKAQHARRLVTYSIGMGLAAGGAASWLDRNPWPLVGAGATAAIMFVLYQQALAGAAADAEQP
jgi:hypothetical protein